MQKSKNDKNIKEKVILQKKYIFFELRFRKGVGIFSGDQRKKEYSMITETIAIKTVVCVDIHTTVTTIIVTVKIVSFIVAKPITN